MECSADFTKYAFKQNPANKGRFVNIGKNHSWQCLYLFCASSNMQAMYKSQDKFRQASLATECTQQACEAFLIHCCAADETCLQPLIRSQVLDSMPV